MGNGPSLDNAKGRVDHISEAARGWLVPLARFGYVAKGVVYIIIGVLAALAAFTAGGKTTGSRGALIEILRQPFGRILLGVIALGFSGYAAWRFAQAIMDTENKGTGARGIATRIGYAAVSLLYLSLSYSAVRLIFGQGGIKADDQSQKEWTAAFLSKPLGQWVVGAAGLCVIVFGVAQFYRAYRAKFRSKLKREKMGEGTLALAIRFGQSGLAARGVVFILIGIFLLQAAIHSNPSEARGLSGALKALEQQPFGPWLLGVVALGLVVYGIYMLLLARYRRMIL